MPVNLLLCEGAPHSPDAEILNRLLSGLATIRPAGHKYGIGNTILTLRQERADQKVAGLLDRDFERDWTERTEEPVSWQGLKPGTGEPLEFGWRWSRKGIENYLLDPDVVDRALGPSAPPAQAYRVALECAADRLAVYTAARTALSNCRPRKITPLPDKWGKKLSRFNHEFPEDLGEGACVENMRTLVRSHVNEQAVREDSVVDRFHEIQPDFMPEGLRRRDFLWTYDGKDLLVQMEGDLRNMGFLSGPWFLKAILKGVRTAADDISQWLPEWSKLRSFVEAY